MKLFLSLYYKIIIWSLVISYLCFAPSDDFNNIHITIPYFDKIVHLVMFLILGVLISAAKYKSNTAFVSIWMPVMAIVYGGIIEIVQSTLLTTRSGDVFDWIADSGGLIIGILLFAYIPNPIKRILVM